MERANVALLAICLGLFGCGGADRDRGTAGERDAKTAEVPPTPVSEEGCLTARGNQFVLTDLERGEGNATTQTFRLIGDEGQLRQHVGKQVRVTGEAEAPKVAVVTESTPPAKPESTPSKPEATGTAGSANPRVTTETDTRVEVRTLKVTSIESTGASCAAETTGGEATRPRR